MAQMQATESLQLYLWGEGCHFLVLEVKQTMSQRNPIQVMKNVFYKETLCALDGLTFEEPKDYIEVHDHVKCGPGLYIQMFTKTAL